MAFEPFNRDRGQAEWRMLERMTSALGVLGKRNGHFFVAFEPFNRDRGQAEWRMLEHMTSALVVLGKRFEFDFDLNEETRCMSSREVAISESLVQSFVLTAR